LTDDGGIKIDINRMSLFQMGLPRRGGGPDLSPEIRLERGGGIALAPLPQAHVPGAGHLAIRTRSHVKTAYRPHFASARFASAMRDYDGEQSLPCGKGGQGELNKGLIIPLILSLD